MLLTFGGFADDSQGVLAVVQPPACVPVKFVLEIGLSVDGFCQRRQRNLELLAAKVAHSDGGSGTEPFNDPELSLWHGRLVCHSEAKRCQPCENQMAPVPNKIMICLAFQSSARRTRMIRQESPADQTANRDRTPLTPKLDKNLISYALAATAAGAGIMALAQNAEAKVAATRV